ncbi:MAG: hypothetical protein RPU42_00895, partial [Candidatus Sedimenticola sp. (ex Thyasira tokunagai)]
EYLTHTVRQVGGLLEGGRWGWIQMFTPVAPKPRLEWVPRCEKYACASVAAYYPASGWQELVAGASV